MGGETQTRTKGTSFPKLSARPVGQQIHSIYEERLRQFTGNGQFESQNLQAYVSTVPLNSRMPVSNPKALLIMYDVAGPCTKGVPPEKNM